MKTYKLFVLAACLCSSSLLAQTADDYVTQGRADLVAHNMAGLAGAYSNFNAAVTLSPTNEDANALVAVTRLLLLPTQPAGSNFLNSLGFTNSGRNVYNWTSTLPKDTNGDTILPSNNTSVMIAFYRTNIMAALAASRTNLAQITDTSFTLSLTADETSIESVTVDYGDILLLQALERVAEFAGYTLNAQNCNVVLRQLQTLGKTNGLTIQSLLSLYPNLLTQSSTSDLTNSKSAFTNAIMLYQQASDFIRNVRPPGAQRLFNLSPDETYNEALFRTELTNALLSLSQPVQLNTNEAFSVYAGAYFAGTKPLRSLMPGFYRDSYINNTLPDYTFGGILVSEPAFETEALLRKLLGYPYAGIYGGVVYDLTFNDPNAGDFAVFVGTNQQATVVGYDIDSANYIGISDNQYAGISAQFNVDQHGNWQFNSNHISGVSGFGSFSKDGSFSGELDFTNGDSVQLNGNQQSPLGPFQNAAGKYSGTASVSGGTLQAVLSANGSITFCVFLNGVQNDGGQGQLGLNNYFTTTSVNGATVSGTLNPSTFQFNGNFNSSGGSGTWNMSRSANVPFDVAPVITTLPANKILPLGTNATFSLVATGSPPICYQWYFNSNAIPFATTNTLVVSNLQYSSAGTYSVAINNCGGGTNASATLTVVPETIPPVVAITNIKAGMLVSNASFTVMGTATDNVAVAGVYWSLSNAVVNTGFAPAMTANNWANWSTNVTLTPGTNTVRAYAVDTSGNISTTNSATLVYILSATLTVQTNGFGTISPNYNGTSLQIGKNYSMTATAGSGFAFVNWTGSITTNGATLQFTMASNLTFTANFADVTKPTSTISAPTSGQRISNAVFTVTGTASDNWQLGGVQYQLNNTGWSNATSGNVWTNWSADMTLVPGTNVVQAYAVDTTGNRSTTNSVSFQYIVSTPLQVQMTGLGTLSPNYSNAVLAVGTNYTMTASPGTGFRFTNWTGGTSLPLAWLTNGTTVQFRMQTNLILQANFVDNSKPTLTITNLASGQRLSNAVFTVKGTASDNWQVAGVQYQLNNTGWSNANSGNVWTNWAATNLTLIPGTNVVQAFAMDTTGNLSTTNSVSFQYVVTNQLGVRALGLGTLNPNYSNAWLEIGRNYSMTATPGSGFMFTNWTISTNWIGDTKTNNATVQFMMKSNLTLQVAFVDVTRPTLTITAPTAGQKMTNALAAVRGTASDNWGVTNVWYQLNSNAWSAAFTANHWTNWSVTLALVMGTNTVKAYAMDLGGNLSTTGSVSFVSSNAFKLQLGFTNGPISLTTNGLGFNLQLSPGLNGRIEASTDLVNWVTLTNFVGSNTTLYFRDAAATNLNLRFYRAATP